MIRNHQWSAIDGWDALCERTNAANPRGAEVSNALWSLLDQESVNELQGRFKIQEKGLKRLLAHCRLSVKGDTAFIQDGEGFAYALQWNGESMHLCHGPY